MLNRSRRGGIGRHLLGGFARYASSVAGHSFDISVSAHTSNLAEEFDFSSTDDSYLELVGSINPFLNANGLT